MSQIGTAGAVFINVVGRIRAAARGIARASEDFRKGSTMSRIRSAVVAAVLTAAFSMTGAALAAPAHAAIPPGPCNSGSVCLWTNAYYQGDRWQWPDSVKTLPAFIDGKASSAVNRGRECTVYLYPTVGWAGSQFLTMYRDTWRENLQLDKRGTNGNYNDIIRSVKWCSPA
jgi:peptidase inhibitor family I36